MNRFLVEFIYEPRNAYFNTFYPLLQHVDNIIAPKHFYTGVSI